MEDREDAAKRPIVFAFASLRQWKTIRIQQVNSRSSNSGFTYAKYPRDSVVEHDDKAMHVAKRKINAIEDRGRVDTELHGLEAEQSASLLA